MIARSKEFDAADPAVSRFPYNDKMLSLHFTVSVGDASLTDVVGSAEELLEAAD